MERNISDSTNRDGLLLRSESKSAATTSSDFVLQWGNRKRLRCMKFQAKDHINKNSSGSGLAQRATTRIDRRVVRSDLSKREDPNSNQLNSNINAGKSNGGGNVYFNLCQRQASPSHRILRYPLRLSRNMKWQCFEWFFICYLLTLFSSPLSSYANVINDKILHVGEELFKETMPLQNGARLYHLQGLKSHTWYEMKISYPASIPASFSLQLQRGAPDMGLNPGRKLLNTEKIIFKNDGISLIEQGDMSVLVNVEPEGVIAIPGKHERKYIMYNIVCDELVLGIPHEAWYVVVMVLLCLVLAFVVPSYLPAYLLPKNGRQTFLDHTVTKAS